MEQMVENLSLDLCLPQMVAVAVDFLLGHIMDLMGYLVPLAVAVEEMILIIMDLILQQEVLLLKEILEDLDHQVHKLAQAAEEAAQDHLVLMHQVSKEDLVVME